MLAMGDGKMPWEEGKAAEKLPLKGVRLLSPVVPSKVVCVGLNYADHAVETKLPIPKEPCLFMKPATAVIGPEEKIIYPAMSQRVDYEAELGVVIKKKMRNVEPEQAADYILGYTCLNDVTARDLQKSDGQWTRAKSFDTFCPIGPWVVEGIDPSDLAVKLRLNGEQRQSSRTRELIFNVPRLVSFMSKVMTLLPGDVIATGTPSGIGPMQKGDVVEVEIEGIGVLRNVVA